MLCKVQPIWDLRKVKDRICLGKAAGINAVYATLFDAIHQAYPDDPAAEIQVYLGSEPHSCAKAASLSSRSTASLKRNWMT